MIFKYKNKFYNERLKPCDFDDITIELLNDAKVFVLLKGKTLKEAYQTYLLKQL